VSIFLLRGELVTHGMPSPLRAWSSHDMMPWFDAWARGGLADLCFS
jgi:hypothetical protein